VHAVPPGVYSALRARAAPAFIVPLRVQVVPLVHIPLLLDFLTFYYLLFRFASRAGPAEPSATMLTSPAVRPAEQTEDRSIARRPQ
jgi:hypothetical protein